MVFNRISACGILFFVATKKNSAAMELGSMGGKKKVPKGFSMMDPERRSSIAKKAAAKRWGTKKKKKKA
jgi:hypothetical protein